LRSEEISLADSLRIGWNWPEVRNRLKILVMIGIRTLKRLLGKPKNTKRH